MSLLLHMFAVKQQCIDNNCQYSEITVLNSTQSNIFLYINWGLEGFSYHSHSVIIPLYQ